MFGRLDAQTRRPLGDKFLKLPQKPDDYRKNNTDHIKAMLGAEKIGISVGSSKTENWSEPQK